ncbi:aspartic proteinase precursor [Amylocarpus encephaloides]|uniref:Aspartic proteinase n=1 Tax=Amylocarpus encephaloides TaxID=45428 RepID=A0A9P7YP18_9HELO|nr:aspartic proteinase precursor [Amylocarpus encephaloides]
MLYQLTLSTVNIQARVVETRASEIVAEHVFPLTRRASGQASRLGSLGIAPLSILGGGVGFSCPITLGTTFDLIVDTGSSDTWVASTTFACRDPRTGEPADQSACAFGPLYDRQDFQEIPDQNFQISYGDGSSVSGVMGYAQVTLGGIQVNSEIAAVNQARLWRGDHQSSGLFGLSYSGLTSAFNGTDLMQDSGRTRINYDPIFATMYKAGKLKDNVFSLAIERGHVNQQAGVLALGGLPHVHTTKPYVTTPIVKTNYTLERVMDKNVDPTYQFYSIQPDAYIYGLGNSTSNSTLTTEPAQTLAIVDSGTTLNYLPAQIARAVAAAFDPPGIFLFRESVVLCDAVAPKFGIKIQDQVFYLNPKDMIFKDESTGRCYMSIVATHRGLNILGDAFMKNVIAVFDVGKGEMRFAEHIYK